MKVTIYSHNFSVRPIDKYGYEFLKQFGMNNFGETDFRAIKHNKNVGRYGGEKIPVIKKTYATSTHNGREFRFHIHCLDMFKEAIKNDSYLKNTLIINTAPLYTPKPVDFKVLDKYVPRDDQLDKIEYLIQPGPTKALTMRPGTGKTFCSLYAVAKIGLMLFISIETRFFNLWEEALLPGEKQILQLETDEVLFISGSKELKKLMELALDEKLEKEKVIVVASRTLANFFETYERFAKYSLEYYPIYPIQLMELLQVGPRIKDEVHLSLHANFIEELYLHLAGSSFSLSGTLEDGTFKDRIFGIMFPKEIRSPESEMNRYIDVTALHYGLMRPDTATYTIRGSSDYNHNEYEKWILKDPKRKQTYLDICVDWVKVRYLAMREEGQPHRCAIFATSVNMATAIRDELIKRYPALKVTRYAASTGDDYNESRETDILVTTVQSFGVGFDLTGLICCLLTTAINAQNTNIQVLERLRELKKWPHITPVFDYLVCYNIPKHVAYHEDKQRQFNGRVKKHATSYLSVKL